MQRKENIVRASASGMKKLLATDGDKTDWAAAKAMTQAEIEKLADEDEGPLPTDWAATVEIGLPQRKQVVNMRLDADLLAWYRAHGPGYQTRINAVLRAFMESRKAP